MTKKKIVKEEIVEESLQPIKKVIKAAKVVEKPAKKVEEPKKKDSFLEIEEVELSVDILKVENWPTTYVKKWCRATKMPNGRRGNWVVVDKTHPDFKGIVPTIDHTPDASMVTNGDLILCCMRKETHKKLLEAKSDITKRHDNIAQTRLENDIDKLSRSLGKHKGQIKFTK